MATWVRFPIYQLGLADNFERKKSSQCLFIKVIFNEGLCKILYQHGLADDLGEKSYVYVLNFSVPPSTTYDTQNASNNDLSTGRPSEGTSMLSQQLFKAAFGDNSLQQGNEIL